MRQLNFSSKIIPILLGIVLVIFLSYFSFFTPAALQSFFKRLDYIAYDLRLNMFLKKEKPLHSTIPIAIIDIDEKSLKHEGRWPWDRNIMARLIKELYAQGATVIAFDILFSEPEKNAANLLLERLQASRTAMPIVIKSIEGLSKDFDNDALFARQLSEKENSIILGIFFGNGDYSPIGTLPSPIINLQKSQLENLAIPSMQTYVANIKQLQQAAKFGGALSVVPDEDGTIRRYPLLYRYGDNLYPSLALEAVRLYLLINHINIQTAKFGHHQVITNLKLGKEHIPTDPQGRLFIPYKGRAQYFPYYSATDVLNRKLPPNQLANTLVFIGTSAVGLNDIRSTPVASVYPGVEIHATVADAIFQHEFPYIPDWAPGAQFIFMLLSGILLVIFFTYVGPLSIILITFSAIGIIFASSMWLWQSVGIILPIIMPISLVILLATWHLAYGFLSESHRKGELKRAFEQYVPSGHVAEIMRNPNQVVGLAGERKNMSVLFMDIRGFTTISEKLNIIELKKLLNFFLTEMTHVIFNHGGTIDKYVGDMVMAFWGAPLPDEQHAKHAIQAGLSMLETTKKLSSTLSTMGLPSVNIGVGVNTGIMDVGDMGSQYRRAYTVLGDAVNLASRLESLTKYYGVGMIVGETTREKQEDFIFRQLDKVRVKGKAQGVAIFQPIGSSATVTPAQHDELAQYEKALNAYFMQQWFEAYHLFSNLKQQQPEFKLYQLYLDRIESFKQNPLKLDWDGIWEHHEK